MLPTLEAINQLGGSGTNEEIVDKIIEIQNYPTEVQTASHTRGNRTKLEYRAAWARTNLKRVGAINNSNLGVWSITKIGGTLSDEEIEQRIKNFRTIERQKRRETAETINEVNTDLDDETDQNWKVQLLDVLKQIEPSAFERLCQRVLRESGFIKVQVTGKSGDGGIDGIGVLRINLLSFQVCFQCKRHKDSVGSSMVRDFRGAMIGRCDKGLMMTTGSFTLDARKEATRDGAPTIDLIDGEYLCDLLKKLKLGVQTDLVEEVTPLKEWFEKL